MEKFSVVFYPDDITVSVDKDATVLSACVSAGIAINAACGGDGVCGRCKIRVKKGKVYAHASGNLTFEEREQGIFLACLTEIQSNVEIEIPPESRLSLERVSRKDLQISVDDIYTKSEDIDSGPVVSPAQAYRHVPLATKIYLELPQPNLDDRISDLERIYRAIRAHNDLRIVQTGLANIRRLGELLRSADWRITVTLGNRNGTTEIVLIEPGDTAARNYGICFDIGTTTLSAQLVDLNAQKILGTKATYNKQINFGSDVITRIIHAHSQEGLAQLHAAVTDELNRLVLELIQGHAVDLNDVTCVVCAGNTTMIHLLLQVDPTYIRRDPYVPTANFVPVIRAHEAGLKINPRGLLSCIPGVASYVGGDITAGVLSCGLDKQEDVCLLIDIGTNGEVVLGNKDFLISAAASAGPAFEGSGMQAGMRAAKGAIQKVRIDPKTFAVTCDVIGGGLACGICGSGYIDILAQLLKLGIADKSGKLQAKECGRVRKGDLGWEFVIMDQQASGRSGGIVITEADIENIKRAKAAIYAACSSLLKHMGFDFSSIKKFFIAGGFGTYLDVPNAISLGLLPDMELKRFIFVGNSSLAGARSVLLSGQAALAAEDIARKITYLELSVQSDYMDEYMAALFFPHTDIAKFPSVAYTHR